ncbi:MULTISPECIES: MerR family transcriptional regulator [unclassified Enterococcus]|uniref:MerR family transcriptional regulator n=1 Tax=unclassified Enterococcus TaxID=2608891 RepID=UPI0015561D20|nr:MULTISPECIES: MerR family transcriptional regulator [unclassified Enterococcus]MBS7576319.1 MerR family transcriptional regulator [Enterococcus sp. MMGLQ5-2]MBS7583552.1 MerR family transcriptional regulator [Enterococcus sp. MMGLQ5-1]NPD11414.1 MerR family transcriptional regulator [Enterococcus sp. MMGLQ5-1]NPD36157.1 MerR family transcriptional regulator [Enterococcus sp. MMGLQ5-2]
MTQYSIGQFAKKSGLSIDTLRYYEKEAIIFSQRDSNNRRYYLEADYEWLLFILRLKKTGMTIKNIKEYAKLRYQGDSTISNRLKLLFEQLEILKVKQTEISQNIEFIEDKIEIYKKMTL